jgi:membrane associated rhomboid family serine protease
MFMPLKDDNPLEVIRFQYVCLGLIILNVVVFLLTGPLRGDEALSATLTGFGVVPAEFLGAPSLNPSELNPVAEPFTLISYMFLHAGWMHLIGNVAFLWVFGDNVEDAFGHVGFFLFFLLCGVAAAFAHVFMQQETVDPLVGASGAISGVLSAYLLLYPKARVWILLLMRIPMKIPAWIVLIGWIGLQFLGLYGGSEGNNVAWWTHIGGFAMGLLFTLVLRSPLFARA